jgi:hypothetical protein
MGVRLFGGFAISGVATSALLQRCADLKSATDGEKRRLLPGDELVGGPRWQLTRAVTINARNAEAWPWLVQMGCPPYHAAWNAPYWRDRAVWRIKERTRE